MHRLDNAIDAVKLADSLSVRHDKDYVIASLGRHYIVTLPDRAARLKLDVLETVCRSSETA